jgi:hypothetical protein
LQGALRATLRSAVRDAGANADSTIENAALLIE